MVQSAQSLISTTRTSLTQKQQEAATERIKDIWAKEKAEERKEKVKKQAKRYTKVQKGIQKLKGYKTDKKGRVIKPKQPKFSKAVMGLTRAFMPDGADEGFQSSKSKTVSGRSRGRPPGTFKKRYVEGYGVISVPTKVYNRMMAEVKAKRRLAEAKRQAMYQQQMEAEQIAMTQDPRFQQSSEDAWADSEDMEHEANIERIRQQRLLQQQMQQQGEMQKQAQPSLLQRGVRGVIERAGSGISLMGSERERFQREGQEVPQQLDSYGRPQLDMDRHRPRNPGLSLLGGKANLFGSQNREIPVKRNIMNQRNELF